MSEVFFPVGDSIVTVSAEDESLWCNAWFINGRGYVVGQGGSLYPFQRLHRVVMERMLGRSLRRHELVDHINGDKLDNRRENLRLATNAENQFNRDLPAHNTTGYKGVYRNPNGRRQWTAAITVNRKKRHLGSFHTAEDAARAYDAAAQELAGVFARGNFQ